MYSITIRYVVFRCGYGCDATVNTSYVERVGGTGKVEERHGWFGVERGGVLPITMEEAGGGLVGYCDSRIDVGVVCEEEGVVDVVCRSIVLGGGVMDRYGRKGRLVCKRGEEVRGLVEWKGECREVSSRACTIDNNSRGGAYVKFTGVNRIRREEEFIESVDYIEEYRENVRNYTSRSPFISPTSTGRLDGVRGEGQGDDLHIGITLVFVLLVVLLMVYVCIVKCYRWLHVDTRDGEVRMGLDMAKVDICAPVVCVGSDYQSYGDGSCCICMDDFIENDRVRVIGVCRHAMHQVCLDRWFENRNTCPYCRVVLDILSPVNMSDRQLELIPMNNIPAVDNNEGVDAGEVGNDVGEMDGMEEEIELRDEGEGHDRSEMNILQRDNE